MTLLLCGCSADEEPITEIASDNIDIIDTFWSTPSKYVFQTGDVFARQGLPTTMPVQMSNTCVTSIMEYANQKVFHGNMDEGEYILYYWKTYGEDVVMDGVSLENISSFVNTFFKVSPFVSYTNAIDNKCVVMTDVPGSEYQSRHNILVLGYHLLMNASIYMDPEKGTWYCVRPDFFAQDYNFVLSGIK